VIQLIDHCKKYQLSNYCLVKQLTHREFGLDTKMSDSSSIIYYITINNRSYVRRNFRSNKAPKRFPLWNAVDSHYNNSALSQSNQDPVLDAGILSIDHVHLRQAPLPLEEHLPLLRVRTQQR
jgi:hypothetical protein